MEMLTIIACRKNSKRVKNKNFALLGKKPLVQWTFDLINSNKNFFNNVIVSTDDERIIKLAEKNKILAPFKRPKRLSNDRANSIDVACHAIKYYEKFYKKIDFILYLQPTSPFRIMRLIKKGIGLFKKNKMRYPVLSLSKFELPMQWIFFQEKKKFKPFFKHSILKKNSQNLDNLLILNGYLRICSKKQILKNNRFILHQNMSIICEDEFSKIDIDTIDDFKYAESLLQNVPDSFAKIHFNFLKK